MGRCKERQQDHAGLAKSALDWLPRGAAQAAGAGAGSALARAGAGASAAPRTARVHPPRWCTQARASRGPGRLVLQREGEGREHGERAAKCRCCVWQALAGLPPRAGGAPCGVPPTFNLNQSCQPNGLAACGVLLRCPTRALRFRLGCLVQRPKTRPPRAVHHESGWWIPAGQLPRYADAAPLKSEKWAKTGHSQQSAL